jgi:hypothetical protein
LLAGKDKSTFGLHLGSAIGKAAGRGFPPPKTDKEAGLSQQCNQRLLNKALDP